MCVTLPSLSHLPSHLTNSRTPCLLRRFAARRRAVYGVQELARAGAIVVFLPRVT